jgi:hypothetical protein
LATGSSPVGPTKNILLGNKMPCIKCNNGKWKYGKRGKCQFDTLEACKQAEAAIHARENDKKEEKPKK